MAAGGVLICRDVALGRLGKAALPPPVRMKIEPAVLRYGWYVGRRSFGLDLYQSDRGTRLRRERIGSVRVDSLLRSAWRSARRALRAVASAADLAAASAAVAGRSLLPVEADVDTRPELLGGEDGHPLGDVLGPIARTHFSVEAVIATWDFTVLRVRGRRDLFVTVPAGDTAGFLDELRAGSLDDAFTTRMEEPPRDARLQSFGQAIRRGVYDRMGEPAGFVPPERGPDGRLVSAT